MAQALSRRKLFRRIALIVVSAGAARCTRLRRCACRQHESQLPNAGVLIAIVPAALGLLGTAQICGAKTDGRRVGEVVAYICTGPSPAIYHEVFNEGDALFQPTLTTGWST